jgi:hypothetical protein
MKIKKRWMGFWLLTVASFSATAYSLYAHAMTGVFIYDRNFEILSGEAGRLSRVEVDHIVRASREAVSFASWPLFPVLAAWVVAGFVLLRSHGRQTHSD